MTVADDFVELPVGEFEETLRIAIGIAFEARRAKHGITSLTTLTIDPARVPVRYRARHRASMGAPADGAIPRRLFPSIGNSAFAAGALRFGRCFSIPFNDLGRRREADKS